LTLDINPDVVVVGMGALVQDRFAVLLRDLGCRSSIYTCGGFLHQTINRINYYPKWINRLHLRTLYRLIKEPYVWKQQNDLALMPPYQQPQHLDLYL